MGKEIIKKTENRSVPSNRWWNPATGYLRRPATTTVLACTGVLVIALAAASIGNVFANETPVPEPTLCAQVKTPAFNKDHKFVWLPNSCFPDGYTRAPDPNQIPQGSNLIYLPSVMKDVVIPAEPTACACPPVGHQPIPLLSSGY